MGKTFVDESEIVVPPRQWHLSFYLVLLIAVVPLWSIVPLAWLSVIYSLRTGIIWSFGWRGRAWFTAALCEVAFSIHHYHLVKHVSGLSPLPPTNIVELKAAFRRVLKSGLAHLSEDVMDKENLDEGRTSSPAEEIEHLQYNDPRAMDFRNYLRNWFGKVAWSSIHIHEIHSWLYWSSFNSRLPPVESIPPSHREVLDEAVDLLQKRAGCTIPKGNNPDIKPLLLTLDELKVTLWRPFLWYAFVGIGSWLFKRWYEHRWDVQYGNYNGLDYLVRIPRTWNPATGARPIVFWHGLGLGIVQYNSQLVDFMTLLPDRPLLVPLQPHISQEIFHPRFLVPMGRRETVECMTGLLEELGWVAKRKKDTSDMDKDISVSYYAPSRNGVTMISHSNGSYAHAWMLKAYPDIVTSSCFVDPVTFCSWEGDTCYNFNYKPCATGIELIMRYFVSTELGVANLIQRHFDWSSNSLWYEEIPNAQDPSKTIFVLGAKDDIMNSERVKRYLTSHGIWKGLWFDPNGVHGQALIRGEQGHTAIMKWLHEQR